jgi:ATP-dependent Clp protease ATP-binding subunit ClpC
LIIPNGLSSPNKPIGSYLMIGKTGVGKTYLAKKIAEEVFGSENYLIRFDMSEYSDKTSVNKLIGSSAGYVGYEEGGLLTEAIKKKKYAVLLVDEIEKANSDVFNLFLQILDEGKIKSSSGNIVRFDNTLIIMTSNIGFNKQTIGFNNNKNEYTNSKIKEVLSLEIINRIDNIVIFNRLNEKDIRTIVSRKIKNIKNTFKKEKISIIINKQVIEDIIEDSNYKEYGARKIDKLINTKLNDLIIEQLLNGQEKITIETLH